VAHYGHHGDLHGIVAPNGFWPVAEILLLMTRAGAIPVLARSETGQGAALLSAAQGAPSRSEALGNARMTLMEGLALADLRFKYRARSLMDSWLLLSNAEISTHDLPLC